MYPHSGSSQFSSNWAYRRTLPGGSQAAGSNDPRRKQCNCRNSKCLKLYCECFAAGQ